MFCCALGAIKTIDTPSALALQAAGNFVFPRGRDFFYGMCVLFCTEALSGVNCKNVSPEIYDHSPDDV